MIETSTRQGISSLIRLPGGGGQYTFGPTFNYYLLGKCGEKYIYRIIQFVSLD